MSKLEELMEISDCGCKLYNMINNYLEKYKKIDLDKGDIESIKLNIKLSIFNKKLKELDVIMDEFLF